MNIHKKHTSIQNFQNWYAKPRSDSLAQIATFRISSMWKMLHASSFPSWLWKWSLAWISLSLDAGLEIDMSHVQDWPQKGFLARLAQRKKTDIPTSCILKIVRLTRNPEKYTLAFHYLWDHGMLSSELIFDNMRNPSRWDLLFQLSLWIHTSE